MRSPTDPAPEDEGCLSCRFWLRTDYPILDYGTCRRHSAMRVDSCHTENWCGDFERSAKGPQLLQNKPASILPGELTFVERPRRWRHGFSL